ncbi:hypothetical protein D3C76_1249320 [compost metagenome]
MLRYQRSGEALFALPNFELSEWSPMQSALSRRHPEERFQKGHQPAPHSRSVCSTRCRRSSQFDLVSAKARRTVVLQPSCDPMVYFGQPVQPKVPSQQPCYQSSLLKSQAVKDVHTKGAFEILHTPLSHQSYLASSFSPRMDV